MIVFWFRRDLRLEDNAGLYQALRQSQEVLPLFIFDKDILDLLPRPHDRRVHFIHERLQQLKKQLAGLDSDMVVRYGSPMEVWQKLLEDYPIEAVYTNHDYEPYARQRDTSMADFFASKGVGFHTFKDQCIFEKKEVLSNQGTVYTVFTPYSRKWKAQLQADSFAPYDTQAFFQNFVKNTQLLAQDQDLIALEAMGFAATDTLFPSDSTSDQLIRQYKSEREFPAREGTSRLGVHLRFGTISIRQLAARAQSLSEGYLNELIWRDFYMMILWNFPHAAQSAFKKDYDHIAWRNNEEEFARWCEGQTGYPIVDAGMRELLATGLMHNRLRMITASFLTKHLLIDWRWGERFFAEKLLDFELSSNNGGWQWAASSGCDAAPYFRVFNPYEQSKKFDPQLEYTKKWVPEFQEFNYPQPIVEHRFARERVLKVYQESLQAAKLA